MFLDELYEMVEVAIPDLDENEVEAFVNAKRDILEEAHFFFFSNTSLLNKKVNALYGYWSGKVERSNEWTWEKL